MSPSRGRTSSWRSAATWVVTLALIAICGPFLTAQMFVTTGRDTLRGLPGVEVAIEELEPSLERDGLTRTAIRSDVEGRLKARGVRVYASQKENPSEAKPYLYVHVNAMKLPDSDLYVASVQVQLRQTLRSVVTGSNVVNAMTWDTHNVVAVPRSSVAAVREEILEYVDRFIADWQAVH